jgi:hypothetical protein
MVCFQTKNPNLGKFWRVLLWKIFVYFMTIWSILRPLEIFYSHLVYFLVIWYIFHPFGIWDQEKSGNPDEFVIRSELLGVKFCTGAFKLNPSVANLLNSKEEQRGSVAPTFTCVLGAGFKSQLLFGV